MFLTLALVLLQGPAPQWSQDVDDQFWQALHLLEVEDRAVEAAASLASLLEEPSVRQYRGQTGYLLAQQYRALRAAGRMEEAEALLTTIRADVAGTDLAAAAESVVQLANRVHPSQSGVDDELLQLLLDAAKRDESYLQSLLRGYGERAIPELLRVFDQPEDYAGQKGPATDRALRALWAAAWSLDSDKFLDAMASRVRLRGTNYARTLPIAFPGPTGDAQAEFLVKLFTDERMEVAGVARRALPGAEEHAVVRDTLVALVKEGAAVSPMIVNDVIVVGGNAARIAIVEAGLESKDENLRALTHALIEERFDAYSLHHLAERRGDLEARLVLIRAQLSEGLRSQFESGIHKHGYAPAFEGERISRSLDVPVAPDGSPAVDWTQWLGAQLSFPNDEVQERALAAILGMNKELRSPLDPLVRSYLSDHGVPESFSVVWVSSAGIAKAIPELAPAILEELDDPETGDFALLLMNQSPVLQSTLTVEQLLRVAEVVHGDELESFAIGFASAHPGGVQAWRLRLWEIVDSELPIQVRARALIEVLSWKYLSGEYLSHDEIIRACDWAAANLELLQGAHLRAVVEIISGAMGHRVQEYAREGGSQFDETLGRWISIAASARDMGMEQLDASDASALIDQAWGLGLSCERSVRSLFLARGLWSWSSGRGPIWEDIEEVCWSSPALMRIWIEFENEASGIQLDGKNLLPYRDRSGVTRVNPASLQVILESDTPRISREFWQLFAAGTLAPLDEVEVLFGAAYDRDLLKPELALYVVQSISADESEQERFVQAVRTAWALPDLVGRRGLVNTVASRYTPELIPFLLEAQAHPDSKVSAEADAALSRYTFIRETRASWEAWERAGREGSPIDSLVEKMAVGNKRIVRLAAIESLGTLQAKEALPFLVELLEEDDEEIVAAVTSAMAQIHAASKGEKE